MKSIKEIFTKILFANGFDARLQKLEDFMFELEDQEIVEVDEFKDLQAEVEDKVDRCDYESLGEDVDRLKDSSNEAEENISDIKTELQEIQEELTQYRLENARMRRAIQKIAEKVDLEFAIDTILGEKEEDV